MNSSHRKVDVFGIHSQKVNNVSHGKNEINGIQVCLSGIVSQLKPCDLWDRLPENQDYIAKSVRNLWD